MRLFRKVLTAFGALFFHRKLDKEMDEEMRSHVELRTQANIDGGMNPEEARFAALRQFGWTETIKEDCRQQRGVTWLENLGQDVRYALRQLGKSPGFTSVAVTSLALGIGAATAVFSIANGVLLRSLPVPNPDELRVLRWSGSDARLRSFSGDSTEVGGRLVGDSVGPATFFALREQGGPYADVFAFAPLDDVVVRSKGTASSGKGMIVSDNFFRALGGQAQLGRTFAAGANDAEAARQVVITHRWWVEHFGADPAAVGGTMQLNGQEVTVIGVLPATFPGVRAADGREFFLLLAPGSPFLQRAFTSSEHWWIRMMARVKPGATDEALKGALDVTFAVEAKDQMKTPGILVQPGRGGFAADRDQLRKPLKLMLGAVGVVMLVACVNLAGLSLARGASRQHEWAVRAALGAPRGRLIRQSLAESLVLALLGGSLGGLLSVAGTEALARLLSGAQGALQYDVSLDFRVLGFCLILAVATSALSGCLPALRAGSIDPLEALKARGALNAPRLRMGRALVGAQVALSLMLLTGAGLYLRTVGNLRDINPGFDTENLLVFQINPTVAGYSESQLAGFYTQLQEELAATPGVRDATLIMNPLLDNQSWSGGFSFRNRAAPEGVNLQTHRLIVGERYFSTMGIPIVLGRSLRAADDQGTKVIVVNETFAKNYLSKENPLGQAVNFLRQDWQIVGICRDTKYGNLKEPAPPTAYMSFRQAALNFRTYFAVRTSLPPLTLTATVRKVVARVNSEIPVARVVTQEQLRDGNISQERLFAALCGALAGLALLLSCIGLYGLMAYNVTRRASEIGIRVAIGASPERIVRSLLGEALILTLVGICVGVPAALAATQLIKSQLYGLRSNDPLTLAVVITILLMVAIAAAWIPARGAAKISPMAVLRND